MRLATMRSQNNYSLFDGREVAPMSTTLIGLLIPEKHLNL